MILVTGGAGFIGSNIALALAARGERVVVCDTFGDGDKWKNVRTLLAEEFVFPEALDGWLAANGDALSAIVHMGAISATTERDVDLIVASNLQLSKRLWSFCAARAIPFVYASSAATYGDGARGFDDRSDDAYLSALRPLNPYGWSKLLFDRQVMAAIGRGDPAPSKWAGLRFFNVYGPREDHKGSMRSVMRSNWEKLRAGEPLRLFRSDRADYVDGGQMRDFVHVDDCVAVVLWMLDNSFPGDIYNVGTGTARRWVDVGEAMFAALGRATDITFIDMPEQLKGRYQYFTEARMDKLRAAGFDRPPTGLTEGVAAYFAFLERESDIL
ncbi:ADP-glyceromanno-heptose 6-epimerase [Celeribacter sp.]|uniref:ADP-glyceromanno-heptose 6-epimerase n=1 Tax=Alphaproteobacteria TaxID=28211 RepID=UPI003A91EF96